MPAQRELTIADVEVVTYDDYDHMIRISYFNWYSIVCQIFNIQIYHPTILWFFCSQGSPSVWAMRLTSPKADHPQRAQHGLRGSASGIADVLGKTVDCRVHFEEKTLLWELNND